MAETQEPKGVPARPARNMGEPVPPIPEAEAAASDDASTVFSHFRTGLSRHRTGLSEHRTDLSEYRTDLSGHRTEMSMRRTGMSFQRTRMSADRTLMSEMRTALSLIGFGFTINQAFQKMQDAGSIQNVNAPRNFGVALLIFGIVLLAGGIVRHVQFATELRDRRKIMTEDGLIYSDSRFPISVTLVIAVCLLALALAAVLGIVFNLALLG